MLFRQALYLNLGICDNFLFKAAVVDEIYLVLFVLGALDPKDGGLVLLDL